MVGFSKKSLGVSFGDDDDVVDEDLDDGDGNDDFDGSDDSSHFSR